MIFAIASIVYAGTILFFVGTAALILLAWARGVIQIEVRPIWPISL
jgi:hypothetical protein